MKNARKIFSYIIMIAAIIILIVVYKKYNFNNFDKNIKTPNLTKFTRDSEVKYSKVNSYKIQNIDYNDAMISQTISVIPNTPYKVTCMVKVEDVENEFNTTAGGAHICIGETKERSNMITGTEDWQELSLTFNSKNKEEINVGFRLGGYDTSSKGTVWFSDFKLEAGVASASNKWKMGCFIFPNIDVNVEVNGKTETVKLEMSNNDISAIKTNLSRFQSTIREVSDGKMTIQYETYIINEPLRTLSYDEENGYYVSASDVYNHINSYVEENEYDHIYVAFRMADKQKGNSTLISDWIGLGGMDYSGIGFSNIRLPDDRNNLSYEYNYRVNTFPEEVFLHEFLHTLERNALDLGYERPELHNYANYGYSEDKTDGLREWYIDYMNKNISYNGTKIGLPEQIYTYKPAHESNFKYSIQVDELNEPNNFMEIIQSIISRIGKLFNQKQIEQTEIGDNT